MQKYSKFTGSNEITEYDMTNCKPGNVNYRICRYIIWDYIIWDYRIYNDKLPLKGVSKISRSLFIFDCYIVCLRNQIAQRSVPIKQIRKEKYQK